MWFNPDTTQLNSVGVTVDIFCTSLTDVIQQLQIHGFPQT